MAGKMITWLPARKVILGYAISAGSDLVSPWREGLSLLGVSGARRRFKGTIPLSRSRLVLHGPETGSGGYVLGNRQLDLSAEGFAWFPRMPI